jgi:transposase-like protein
VDELQTLEQAIRFFSDPERAFAYACTLRWPDGIIVCPRCGARQNSFVKTRKLWTCYGCWRQFTIKVKTILEDSALGLDKWMIAVWMVANCKDHLTCKELARTLQVSNSSSWFMLRRIRALIPK